VLALIHLVRRLKEERKFLPENFSIPHNQDLKKPKIFVDFGEYLIRV